MESCTSPLAGATLRHGSYYLVKNGNLKRVDANTECTAIGMTLAVFKSTDDLTALQKEAGNKTAYSMCLNLFTFARPTIEIYLCGLQGPKG